MATRLRTKARTLKTTLASAVAAVALAFGVNASAAEATADGSHKFELAGSYYAQCQATDKEDFELIRKHLVAFTDAEVMARTMSDPVKAAELMTVVMDPRTLHVMSKCATEPVMWDTWMRGATDWQKMSRAMSYFMNPAMYMNWMMAPMNPQFNQAFYKMSDPQLYSRWMTAMANPAFYQPAFDMMNPAWYTPRINWMMNPASYQPIWNMMGPAMPAAPQ